MSKIKEMIMRIEELRLVMVKAKKGRSYTDQEVLAASQALDAVLDKYQAMLIQMSKKN